jgi:hypothetical protein
MVVMATQGKFGRLDYIFAEFSIFGRFEGHNLFVINMIFISEL